MKNKHTLEIKTIKQMQLLPCAPDVCQECAVKHESWQAHNQQSLYYQFKFHSKNGRFPTWEDAIAHCTYDIRKQWKIELTELGKWTEIKPEDRKENKDAIPRSRKTKKD